MKKLDSAAEASVDDAVMTALRSDQPGCELRRAVRALLATGGDRKTLVRELNLLRRVPATQGREREENALFDVLDALAGWSVPALEK